MWSVYTGSIGAGLSKLPVARRHRGQPEARSDLVGGGAAPFRSFPSACSSGERAGLCLLLVTLPLDAPEAQIRAPAFSGSGSRPAPYRPAPCGSTR